MTSERAERCRNCMLVRRRGRLCAEHFHEFLGWLCFIGPDVETAFWLADGFTRRALVAKFATEQAPAAVRDFLEQREAA